MGDIYFNMTFIPENTPRTFSLICSNLRRFEHGKVFNEEQKDFIHVSRVRIWLQMRS